MPESVCIFCRVARGEIPADIVHDNAELVAFRDIQPVAPVHILIIPRRHIASVRALNDGDSTLIGRLLLAARDIAEREGIADSGYRLVTNAGADAGQSVDHLHVHLLGGRSMKWPPG